MESRGKKRGKKGLIWAEEAILGRGKGRRAKGEMMDWTWEDNDEWNTAQQNVISQTVVWGTLLPFHWDCYYRWISPTKTSIPRLQHFLDFAMIEAGFENLALKTARVSAPMRQLWHWDEGWIGRERTSLDEDCLLWAFLISADIQLKGKNATVGLLSGIIDACGNTDQPKHG